MTKVDAKLGLEPRAATAQVLSDWWTQPDSQRTALWISEPYRIQILKLWRKEFREKTESPERLLAAATFEQTDLAAEYERLFVGPAAVPCPPYEAVWRTDRPKHEQGTVMGGSTLRMKQIFQHLGVRLRAGEVELPDHIAVELEALSYAWRTDRLPQADALIQLFRGWVPAFVGAVAANSRLGFYRELAELTWEFFQHLEPRQISADSHSSTTVVPLQSHECS